MTDEVPPLVPRSSPPRVDDRRSKWHPDDPGDLFTRYTTQKTRSARAIAFIEGECLVPGGRNAGKLYRLLPFQKRMLRDTLDHGDMEVLWSLPRGAGKTGLDAPLLVFFLFEAEYKVVIAASTAMRTARLAYDRAVAIIKRSPRLMGQVRIFTGTSDPHVELPHRQSSLWALPANESNIVGQAASEALIDEVGYTDPDTYEAISSGMGKVPGNLLLATGTPGLSNRAREDNPMWRRRLLARGEATREDGTLIPPPPGLRFIEYAAPMDADPESKKTWKMANPGLGVLVDTRQVAMDFATLTSSRFRQMRLGQWADASDQSVLQPEQWDALAIETGPIAPGSTICLGFDGSVSRDATALWAYEMGSGRLVELGYWARPDKTFKWEVPRDEVIFAIDMAFTRYAVIAMFMDPWHWREEAEQLAKRYGDRVQQFNTAAPSRMSPATDAFVSAVVKKEITTDGSKHLRAHALAAVAKETPAGRVIVKDARHPQYIDALVAAILAHEAARTQPRLVGGAW